jgi:hypothetical protein
MVMPLGNPGLQNESAEFGFFAATCEQDEVASPLIGGQSQWRAISACVSNYGDTHGLHPLSETR